MRCLEALEIIGVGEWSGEVPDPSPIRSSYPRVLSSSVKAQYERYLDDNYRGHQAMRGENGLIVDTVHLKQDGKGGFTVEPYKPESAPTDIGLDLLIQVGMAGHPKFGAEATKTLDRVMDTLEKLPFHEATGLFHRLYDPKRVVDSDISSVDNLHLALGLWTVARKFPDSPIGQRAKKLFDRMDFSAFFDAKAKLVGGNLKAPKFELEPYRYQFGSEARSVYTVGNALGLFRSYPDGTALTDALKTVPIELGRSGPRDHLRVWNGGVFQSLLPRTLANEERYSKLMDANARNVALYMALDGSYIQLPGGTGFLLPSGVSAGVTEVKPGPKLDIVYSGEVGGRHLKQSGNPNEMDESVVTLHGILLGAAVKPHVFASRLAQTETLKHNGVQSYLTGFGWVDSVTLVTPPGGKTEARPNSAGVGVDKGIEVLTLMEILDPQGLSVSGRALAEDPEASRRLKSAFRIIDERWRSSY